MLLLKMHRNNFTYGKLNQCTRECLVNDLDATTARRSVKGIYAIHTFFFGGGGEVVFLCATVANLVMHAL